MWYMQSYCKICGKLGHWPPDCPTARPIAKVEEIIKAKRPWVKPTITRWVKADSLSTEVDKVSSVDKKSRQEYQREWVRKKREANRAG